MTPRDRRWLEKLASAHTVCTRQIDGPEKTKSLDFVSFQGLGFR